MSAYVIKDLCNGCGMCAQICPNGAVTVQVKLAAVDPAKCEDCEECVFVCPEGAITAGDPKSKSEQR